MRNGRVVFVFAALVWAMTHAPSIADVIQGKREPVGRGARFVMQPAAKCKGVARKSIFAHPPWKEKTNGWIVGEFELDLTDRKDPALRFAMGIRDDHGSDRGVLYRVTVDGTCVFYDFHKDAAWHDVRVSLKDFAGKKVPLQLAVFSLGEHYALWGQPHIVDNRSGNADEVVLELAEAADRAETWIVLQKDVPKDQLPPKLREMREQNRDELARVVPSPEQVAWQRMEFIGFIHFGINTFTNREWGNGKEDPKLFQPTAFDARQWVRVAKDAGIKMLIVTAKHHDGFCLWPTKTTEHCVRNSPWRDGKGDIVGDVAKACREGGLEFGFYLSPWDRNNPHYGDSPAYNKIFKDQLRELLTHYGEIGEVWFDGACGEGPSGKKQVYDWRGYYRVVRERQPKALIAICGPDIRWVGNESGVARETEWSVQRANPARHPGKKWVWWPAECDVSIRPGWFYHESQDDKVKSLKHLLDIYYKSVGRNSVLLLNIPPDRRGLLHENDAKRLRELRRVLDETFDDDLARGKSATASDVRGGDPRFAATRVVDGAENTYWTCAESQTTGWVEIDLGRPASFNRSVVQEHIPLGQRVEAYAIDAWVDGGWKEIARGTTIGHKKLDRFPTVRSSRVRLRILASRANPLIQRVGLFLAPPTEES